MNPEELQKLADLLEAEIGPQLHVDEDEGGFNCCGCSTYRAILDAAKAVIVSKGGDL